MKYPKYLIIFLLAFAGFSLQAKIKLPAIVSSNMVLQRNTTVKIWGWADKGESIVLEASWLNRPVKVVANENGKWSAAIHTNNSLAPQTITLTSESSEIVLNDILFGEVWLCSGQSNMNFSLKGNPGQPLFGSNEAILNSKNDKLRLFTVVQSPAKTPAEKLNPNNASWVKSSPETTPDFSAIAYFFGSRLQQILDVPVGIIHSSWGASTIQAWMSKDVLQEYENIDISGMEKIPNKTQTVLFNGMINPLTNYSIKGVLWYQGEGNRPEPKKYTKLMPAMVKDWRNRWGNNFPFYYVQIAPYSESTEYNNFKNSAFLREAQLKCIDLIPNAFMACTMDIGDKYSIHPPKKKEVADRLLYIALNRDYGFNTIDYSGPIYDSMEISKEGIKLFFKYAENGLYAFNKKSIPGFEISGDDKTFYPAKAKIVDRRYVLLTSEKVPHPKAARYGWQCFFDGSLFDTNLLPAPSFRTDDWDDAVRSE